MPGPSHVPHMFTPAPEPGPLHASHYCEVFNVRPQSEPESEEEIKEDKSTHEDEGTGIWFQPDTVSEDTEEDETFVACFEDLRVAQGEDVHQLGIQQELDDLGSHVLSAVAKGNIKAIALKIQNQLTQNTFQGLQKLTCGHMAIKSKYVAN